MVSNKVVREQIFATMKIVRPYLSLATFYVLTDAFYDWGLLRLPYPYGDTLYFGRYALVVAWYGVKFLKHRLTFRTYKLEEEVKK